MLKAYRHPPEKGFYHDYLQGEPQAVNFLAGHFREAGVFAAKSEEVAAAYGRDRTKLVELLLAYNRAAGCTEETEWQIKKLADPRAVAVLCGQQVGLLTGPLYTVYKALAAVKLAAKLEKELRRPVVPVFWVAAEDHDFSEANHCYVLGRDNKPQKVELPLAHKGEPVGRMQLEAEAGRAVLERLQEVLPQTEFVPGLLAWLEKNLRQSATPADWFARLLLQLTGPLGLVLFDPLLAAGRHLAAPLLQAAVRKRETLEAALTQREAELTACGYRLQVEREEGATLLMAIREKRSALFYRDGSFWTRDGGLVFREEELSALAAAEPEKLSPNVLLRPLVQDYLFPTVAVLLGPGETAYFAQALALYPVLGLVPPVIVPRPGLTVIEPRLVRHIRRYKIPEAVLLADLAAYRDRLLKEAGGVDPGVIFARLKRRLADEYKEIRAVLSRLNPQLGELTDKNLQLLYRQIAFLQHRAEAELEKKNAVMLRHFALLEEGMTPFSRPQERVLNICTYLARYGPQWWQKLAEEFPAEGTHYLYYPEQ
ncbi:MAG TPA: bacillithiol biosynthesis cysteine-adding enzyme BshC [Firmicutes bacterium]|nr:bacillithiol biosynthesis cysteine-adding enzyme BshC [Bacillota bacterium]